MTTLRLFAASLAVAFLPRPAPAAEPLSSELSTEDTFVKVLYGPEGAAPAISALQPGASGTNWITDGGPVGLPVEAFVGTASKPLKWIYKGVSDKDGILAVTYASSAPALEAECRWQAHPGPGPVEHAIRITNKGSEEILLPLLKSLALTLQSSAGHSLESLWVEKGAGRPSGEGVHLESVAAGHRLERRSTGYSGDGQDRDMIPWLCVRDVTARHGWYIGVEFSGNILVSLAADDKAGALALQVEAGIDPTGGEYRTRVPAGGTFETPTVFVGCFEGDFDDAANRLHRFVETHLRPPVRDARYPYIVNNSWGSGMAVDEYLARRMIDDSAAMGIEIFHIDAGWFRSVGDWHPHAQKFPRGLGVAADYTHTKKLLFGLWTGWTQGGNAPRGEETLAVNNPDQREWFTRDYASNWKPHDFTGADVCLGADAARAWCLKDLRRMVREYKLDLLEHDQRMIVRGCDRSGHRHTEHPGDVSYHATLGYYDVYDQLRKENPKLIFEDCVNGGRMVDFGVVRRVHYISITDSYDPLSNRRAFYDASWPLPPSMCEAYISNNPGPSFATFKAMLRSGMTGWCTVMCDTGKWSPEQHAAAKRQFEIYKKWLRPLINAGNLYHIEPRPDGKRWDGVQYFDPKTKKGVLYAFRGTPEGRCPEPEHAFKLKGLKPEGKYRLRYEDKTGGDATRTGAQLATQGVRVTLREPGASELVYIEEE